ncbi:VWFA domain-containing protein [Balamuthia mandrillaris]
MEPEELLLLFVVVVLICIVLGSTIIASFYKKGLPGEVAQQQPQPVAPHSSSSSSSSSFASGFSAIRDKFESIEEVQEALRKAGLESSNLIIAIDYTKSNEYNGRNTFGGRSLHALGSELNPYQRCIDIVGRTLEPFDEDHLIPAFGFGDITTKDKAVFPFFADGRPCYGVSEVLQRYNEITPHVILSGPTSFAPIIKEAIRVVRERQEYHILVIVADGQVTNERETISAIVEATNYPLSIIVIGVGDGPWDMMQEFDDKLPARRFDNFQFVDFNKSSYSEVTFAIDALMEIPDQFRAIRELGLL